MMIIHHDFAFPERYLSGISYIGIPFGGDFETFLGSMCKICVSIFAFGTGYGLANKVVNLKYIGKKVLTLLPIYWITLAMFVLCGLLGDVTYSLENIFENILLIRTDINHAAWYLPFYFLALCSIPLFQKIRFNLVKLILFCKVSWGVNYISPSMWSPISNYFIYMPVVLAGIVTARSCTVSSVMSRLNANGIKGTAISVLVLIMVLGLRVLTGAAWNGFRFIWVYAPVIYITLAVLVREISRIKVFEWLMNFLGGYSTYFWLTHALFTSPIYWTQFIGFCPRISVLVLIWQVLILACITWAALRFCVFFS